MSILSNALYVGKESLSPSSLTETETIDRIAGNVTEKKWLLVDGEEMKPPVNTGKATERHGSQLSLLALGRALLKLSFPARRRTSNRSGATCLKRTLVRARMFCAASTDHKGTYLQGHEPVVAGCAEQLKRVTKRSSVRS